MKLFRASCWIALTVGLLVLAMACFTFLFGGPNQSFEMGVSFLATGTLVSSGATFMLLFVKHKPVEKPE